MSEVELLRRAAALIRERAQAATTGPWELVTTSTLYMNGRGGYYIRTHGHPGDKLDITSFPADAEHIASWHPAVALAVADWLDAEARLHGTVGKAQDKVPDGWALRITSSTLREAVAVARAYLGESS